MSETLDDFMEGKIGDQRHGFAWTNFTLEFQPTSHAAHPYVMIEVPVSYADESTIGSIRIQAFETALSILRAAVRECEERGLEGLRAFQTAQPK
ncbi:MAG: hypothetical protein WAU78_17585 [Roseiarcus sp.]